MTEVDDKFSAFEGEANKILANLQEKKDEITSNKIKPTISNLLTGKLDSTASVLDKAVLKGRLERQIHLRKAFPLNPSCPTCGAVFLVRHNRKTNDPFWGCSDYPNCTHTERYEKFKDPH